jgi:carbon storage regulator
MLILGRREAESICIDDNVIVTVLRIRGGQVKIGIEAPTGMRVDRREVHDRIGRPDVARDVGGKTEGKPA